MRWTTFAVLTIALGGVAWGQPAPDAKSQPSKPLDILNASAERFDAYIMRGIGKEAVFSRLPWEKPYNWPPREQTDVRLMKGVGREALLARIAAASVIKQNWPNDPQCVARAMRILEVEEDAAVWWRLTAIAESHDEFSLFGLAMSIRGSAAWNLPLMQALERMSTGGPDMPMRGAAARVLIMVNATQQTWACIETALKWGINWDQQGNRPTAEALDVLRFLRPMGDRAIFTTPGVARLLNARNPSARFEAGQLLASRGQWGAWMLERTFWQGGRAGDAAISAMAGTGPADGFARNLASAMAADQPRERRLMAAEALSKIGPNASAVIDAVVACLADPDDAVAVAAARAVRSIAPRNDAANLAVFREMDRSTGPRRERLTEALDLPNRRKALAELLPRLSSNDPAERLEAAMALRRLEPENPALIALEKATRERDFVTREALGQAIAAAWQTGREVAQVLDDWSAASDASKQSAARAARRAITSK